MNEQKDQKSELDYNDGLGNLLNTKENKEFSWKK